MKEAALSKGCLFRFVQDSFASGWKQTSESARAAHLAVVAGLAAGLYRTSLLFLEEINQFGNGCFLDAELLLAGMRRRNINAAEPGRARERGWSCGRVFSIRPIRLLITMRATGFLQRPVVFVREMRFNAREPFL